MRRWAVVVGRALTAASVAWAVALPAATYGSSQSLGTLGYGFVLLVYAVGAAVCHQIDARSFHLWGRQMPVCARCMGIYVGAAVAAVVASLVRPRPWDSRTWLVVAALPMVASLIFEWATGTDPGNAVRAATGILVGAAVAAVIIYEVNS